MFVRDPFRVYTLRKNDAEVDPGQEDIGRVLRKTQLQILVKASV